VSEPVVTSVETEGQIEVPSPGDWRSGRRRRCTVCRKWFPTETFHHLPDQRCDDCIPPDIAEQKEQKKLNKAKKEFAKLLDATGGLAADAPRLDQLLSSLFREFGGAEQFAYEWHHQLQLAAQKSPGSKAVLDAYASLAKLVLQSNKLQRQLDVDQMTDQQLKAQMQIDAMEIVVEALKDKGAARFLVRTMKRNGLDISEEAIEQFGGPEAVTEEALKIIHEGEDHALPERP
jgi:hypothetical protein